MRILTLSPNVPFPPIGGGLLRRYHLLRSLAARHEVTLVAFTYGERPAAAPFPIRVVEVPWTWPTLYRELHASDPLTAVAAFRKLADELPQPRFVSIAESPPMERALAQFVGEPFDLVLIEHTAMARFLPCLPPTTPRVIDLHDVHSLMAKRAAEVAPTLEKKALSREAERTLEFERRAVASCTLCLTVSEHDAWAVKSLLAAGNVSVVPNGVDTAFFRPTEHPSEAGNLLFIGLMSHPPNVEAVQHFVAEILPILLEQDDRFKLHVIGRNSGEDLRRLASEKVVVHGFVADVRPYYRRASVVVVPLLRGGGTRLKILEAAACGKAIVTTPIGAEGLEFVDGRDLLVAESPSDFARAVTRLTDDATLRRRLGRSARQVALSYDWDRIGAELCQIVEGLRR